MFLGVSRQPPVAQYVFDSKMVHVGQFFLQILPFHSTKSAYSFLSTLSSYRKDKRAMSENHPKIQIGDNWLDNYFQLGVNVTNTYTWKNCLHIFYHSTFEFWLCSTEYLSVSTPKPSTWTVTHPTNQGLLDLPKWVAMLRWIIDIMSSSNQLSQGHSSNERWGEGFYVKLTQHALLIC